VASEKRSLLIKKTVESYAKLFKAAPYRCDKGIETVMKRSREQTADLKRIHGHPELFRDNGPLEKALARS